MREVAPPRRPDPPPQQRDEGTNERVDALLDKITKEGIGSLTDEEREFLNRASRSYGGDGR